MKKIIWVLMLFLMFGTANVYAVESTQASVRVSFLNQDPSPARAGDTVNIRLVVENIGGGSVENLEVEIPEQYPFTVTDGPALQSIGTLYGYQTNKNYVNVGYKLKINKDAINGQYELKVRYRFNNQEWITSSFNIDITSKQFAQIIYVDKAKLEPGKETDMTFTVTNTGNSPLQNLIFSWSEPNGAVLPVYSDDTKYIKYLDIGKSVDLAYKVIADVNAKPGLYKLSLTLKYESLQTAAPSVISTAAGVFIGGETDFDVAFSQSSQGQTSLSVANTGNNPAQSVSVMVPEQQNFRVSGSNSAIIGNLDKGDYTVVSFQITQSGTGTSTGTSRQRQPSQSTQTNPNFQNNRTGSAGRNNNLRVVIDYTDTTGERRSVEKNVSIQFRTDTTTGTGSTGTGGTAKTGFFSSWTFYIIVIVAIVAGIFYRKKFIAILSKHKKH